VVVDWAAGILPVRKRVKLLDKLEACPHVRRMKLLDRLEACPHVKPLEEIEQR
jgi:hypothetical protein